MHCENLEKFLNCDKYQKHLIQPDLNKIILLNLKHLRKFWKFYCKNSKNIENLSQKFEIIYQNLNQNFCKFYFKIHKTNFKISIFN